MNSTVKGIIIFTSGVLVGAGGMYIGLKKYFEKLEDSHVEDVKAAYGKRLDELEDARKIALGAATEAITASDAYKNGRIGDNESTREALKGVGMMDGIVKSKAGERIDYTSYSRGITEVEEAAKGIVKDDLFPREEDEGDEEDGDDPDDIPEEVVEGASGGIYEISPEKLGTIIGYASNELMYYQNDGIVTDENDEIVDNPESIIGNLIKESGFDEDGRTSMYVRNDRISTDFEIYKVRGTYGL